MATRVATQIFTSNPLVFAPLKLQFENALAKAFETCKYKFEDPSFLFVFATEIFKGGPEEPCFMSQRVGESYEEFFQLLKDTATFSNPATLWQLATHLEDATTLKVVEEYCQAYAKFCKTLKLTEPIGINSKLPDQVLYFEEYAPANPCLVLTYTGWQTLHDIYEFLNNAFGTYKRYLKIHKIELDHRKAILQFPARMAQLFQARIDQKSKAIEQCAVEAWLESPEKQHEIESGQGLALKPHKERSTAQNSTCMQEPANRVQASALFKKTASSELKLGWFQNVYCNPSSPKAAQLVETYKMSTSRAKSEDKDAVPQIPNKAPPRALNLWSSGYNAVPTADGRRKIVSEATHSSSWTYLASHQGVQLGLPIENQLTTTESCFQQSQPPAISPATVAPSTLGLECT